MKRTSFRMSKVVAITGLVGAMASCLGPPETAPQSPDVTQVTSPLYTDSGTMLWNSSVGSSALVPVCFITRPIKLVDGTIRCQNQSAGTDCNGVSIESGVTINPTSLQATVRQLIEDNWMRYANIEFTNWGSAPSIPAPRCTSRRT